MMDVAALREDIAKRRLTRVQSEFGSIPESIPYLQAMLSDELSMDERHLIFAMMLNECRRAKNDHLELLFLRRQATELPPQPILLASLAEGLAKFPEFREEALQTGAESVELARSENRQIRYSLTALVRLSLALDDDVTLERALTELIADASSVREEDTSLEFDFVDELSRRRIPRSVIAAYQRLRG